MRDLAGLRICFLAGTLGQGGAERQLFYMLKALRQVGAVPRVLCFAEGEHWQERIEALGVPVTWVGQSRSRVLRLRRIIQELRRNPVDVLQSQHFYANNYVAAAARFLGLHDIGALRGDGIGEFGTDHRLLGWWGLNMPRTIVANSHVGIENAIAQGASRNRLFFLPNVVDTSLFTPAPREIKTPVRLLTIGRMVEVKRFDRFISMVSSVSDRSSVPIKGLIVGDGPLRAELHSQAEELNLSPDRLQFCGTSEEPDQIYRDADILLLTSDHEGTPNVVLEAMAAGLPVVATRVGGLPALIQHGKTGYLVDPNDEAALTNAVLDLVQNPEKRIAFGQYARELVESHHTFPQLTKHLHQLYDVILPSRETRRESAKAASGALSPAQRLLVVTSVVHYREKGQLFAYGPYALEMQGWAELFPELVLASPCREASPPGDCLPLPANVSIVPQPETGGTTIRAKLAQMLMLPYSVAKLWSAANGTDAIHVRCPGNLGLLGVLIGPIRFRKRIAKFAGQWDGYDGEPHTVRLQRKLLRSRWWNSPVMVYSQKKNEPRHVVPFFTSGLTSSQTSRAHTAAIKKTNPARHVLYTGRLSRAKNIHVLLEAIAGIARDNASLKCTIVGEGPERQALETQAARLGIQDLVTFEGGVAPDAVLAYYETADILVLASESEGWPKALTEGMAFGLICIGSNRGLTASILADGRGFLVPPGDAPTLARALRTVFKMSSEDLHAIRESASTWAGKYTSEKFRDALRSTLAVYWQDEPRPFQHLVSATQNANGHHGVGVMHLTDTLEIGGAEQMAVSLANALPRARFAPHLCTTRRSGPLAELVDIDVGRYSLNRNRTLDIGAVRRLVGYIRRHDIQILHAHGSAVFVSALASMFRPYPAVVWHIHYGRHAVGLNSGWQYRMIRSRVTRSIAVSEALAEWATRNVGMPAERVTYIPNFSSAKASNGARMNLPGNKGGRIVCVANFVPEKDHLNLLRAMERVVQVRPEAHLLLVGGGNNSKCGNAVRAYITTAGLQANVSLLGQRRDIPEILQSVDIGVLSSEVEGLPLALIEYGKAGLPVVVTSVGQCADVVGGIDSGIVVPPKNPTELARGILELLASQEQRAKMGKQLRLRVESVFNEDEIVERVYATYDQQLLGREWQSA